MPTLSRNRLAMTLVELLVVIAIIAVLISLLMPAVQQSREAGRRVVCRNRIRQLALAMQQHESVYRSLPAGMLTRDDGTPFDQVVDLHAFGWGALILPQIEQSAIYEFLVIHSDEMRTPRWWNPTDFSQDAAEDPLPIFRCPSDTTHYRNPHRNLFGNHGTSNYVGVIGHVLDRSLVQIDDQQQIGWTESKPVATSEQRLRLAWPGVLYPNSETQSRDIIDGTSNTFILGERAEPHLASVWCGSDEAKILHNHLGATSGHDATMINTRQTDDPRSPAAFSSRHTAGAMFARADGSVVFINDGIDRVVYEALGQKADGTIIGEYD